MDKPVCCAIYLRPVLFCSALTSATLYAQQPPDQGFKWTAGAQHQYDSNFSRTAEAADEQVSRAAVGLGYNKTFSAQQLGVRVTANHFRYAERDYLDENAWEGAASWRSRFGNSISSLLSYEREEDPVDQLEFTGRDLVARENANASLTLGNSRRLGIIIGAHQFTQSHSNDERRYLDFDDQDLFAELRFRGAAESWVSLRYRTGERSYASPELLPQNLDFDYQQWEIETQWALSRKTELTGVAGYFEREGATNNDEGALAGLRFAWQATEKVTTELAYHFSQPAQGETSDSPTEISNSSIQLRWQWTPKIELAISGAYTEFEYYNPTELVPRVERNISFTPLSLEWVMSDAVRFRLRGQWVERSSPILVRDYDGHMVTGGVALVF